MLTCQKWEVDIPYSSVAQQLCAGQKRLELCDGNSEVPNDVNTDLS